jgi:hypothetical protein
LAAWRYKGEDFPKIQEDVGIYGRQVSSIARIWVTGVQKHEDRGGKCFDNGLHMCWTGQGERNIGVAETSVELNYET